MRHESILLCAALCAAACDQRSEQRPSVVLVVIDTLRAESLEGALHLSRLAAEGVQFRSASAASPWTGPSVAAITTGVYPTELGIHGLFDPLPDAERTLAERLGRAGYATAAVVSNSIAGPAYGHDQGYDSFVFETYKERFEDAPPRPSFTADRVTDAALGQLDGLLGRDVPFFLYVHYTDPHEPYLAPELFRERALDGRERFGDELLQERAFVQRDLSPPELDFVRASYDAEVAFVDREVGRFLERVPGECIVVLTGDHGEEFLEHQGFLHGHTLYEELLHAPLIVKGPGILAGRRVDEPVSLVDVAPTVLELADVGVEGGVLSGTSFAPLLAGGSGDPERPLFAALEVEGHRWLAVRRGRWKLHSFPDQGGKLLFDLERDPGERVDLAARKPAIVASLLALTEDWNGRAVRLDASADAEAERERLEALRAIGYVK